DGTQPTTHTYDKPTTLDNPTKTGYNFEGWYETSACTDQAITEIGATEHTDGNITLYAKWTAQTYTITYKDQGDVDFTGEHASEYPQNHTYNNATRLDNPTKTGYNFKGWYETSACTDEAITEIGAKDHTEGDIILYAKWVQLFTVTFNANGGDAVEAQIVEDGDFALRPISTRTGYGFEGWYLPNATKAFEFETTPITENITLTAQWGANKCTIIFNYMTEEISNKSKAVDYDGYVSNEQPVRVGYDFKGWFTESELVNEYDFTTPVTQDMILYAKWEIKKYKVKFVTGCEIEISDKEINHGELITDCSIARYGYTMYWYTEVNGEREVYDIENTPVTQDMTLYAEWTKKVYTVTFNPMNDNPTPVTQSIKHDENATEPTNINKEGYTLINWYYEDDEGNQHAYDFATPVTQDMTLYANWGINKYTATFEWNIAENGVYTTVEANYNAQFDAPDSPTCEGYDFDGWYDNEEGNGDKKIFPQTMPVNGTTFYAKWTIKQCTVTFITGYEQHLAARTIEYNQTVSQPEIIRTGYNFAGWYKNHDCTEPYDFDKPVTGDISLYAKWTPEIYSVTFNSNCSVSVAGQNVAYNGKVTEPTETLTRMGYDFKGWYYDDQGVTKLYNFESAVTKNLTIYAQWELQKFTVTFEVDGGSEVTSQNVDYNQTVNRPNTPVKMGHRFIGWYVDKAYTAKYDFDTKVTSDETIYAKWQVKSYTVKFEVDGGSEVVKQIVDYGSMVTEPVAPTKEGYVFQGWCDEDGFEYDFTTPVTQDMTLYAKWGMTAVISEESSSKMSATMLAGVAGASVAGAILIGLVVAIILKKRRK
ncbi:MAG: InlB B-repeat-containing protein, partial [Clostridia bacterium]|nr:InlB B-repeat-containing protein [Clostridia bacterium]